MTHIKIDVDDLVDLISFYQKSGVNFVELSSDLRDIERQITTELNRKASEEFRKSAKVDIRGRNRELELLRTLSDISKKLTFHLSPRCGALKKAVDKQLRELSRASVNGRLSPYAQAAALLWAGPGGIFVRLMRDLLLNKLGLAGPVYARPVKGATGGLPPNPLPVDLLKRVATLKDGQVEIVAVPNRHGPPRYIVLIRGIASIARGPNSLIDAVRASGLSTSSLSKGVVDAMKKAGVSKGAEVMLVGHSQGGIAASNLAADKNFNSIKGKDGYVRVSHVMSAGAPTDNKDIPSETRFLSMENTRDVIADLDGEEARPKRGHGQYHFTRGSDFDPLGAHGLKPSYIKEAEQPRFTTNPYVQKFVETADGYLGNPSQPPQRFQLDSRQLPRLAGSPCSGGGSW